MRVSILLFLLTAWAFELAQGANLDVCPTCTYHGIQSAVYAAASGDVIRVAAGTYVENLSFAGADRSLAVAGGFNSDFTSQDGESILNGNIQISPSNAGSVTIERFTISNSASQGIFVWSDNTDLTVKNCKIHDNPSYAIYAMDSKNVEIKDSEVYSNGSYGGISIAGETSGRTVTISGNTIYNHTCDVCNGIQLYSAGNSDVISNNVVYSNYTGIYVTTADSSIAPELSYNTVYGHSNDAIYINGGAWNIHHNLIYSNSSRGVYFYGTGDAQVLNNTVANNQYYGFHFVSGSGSPYIRNNIFYANEYGLVFSNGASGFGESSVFPHEMKYNCFKNNMYGDFIHMGADHAYSFHSEVPGAWDDINDFTWSDSNFFEDPAFIDADSGDYSLKADSFLIDEGNPSDSYANETSPNGSRINIGNYGNTSAAATSPDPVEISDLNAAQDGSKVEISFDTTTALEKVWLKAEYWDGSDYHTISPGSITGGAYAVGYTDGRIATGSSRLINWTGIDTLFPGQILSGVKIKITLYHGGATRSAEFGPFTIDNISPTATPTVTPSETATVTATATGTSVMDPTPSSTPSAIATQTPAITASPTPSSGTATPSPTPTLGRTPESVMYKLKLNSKGPGSLKLSSTGRSCGRSCHRYKKGTVVNIRAVSNAGARLKWIRGYDQRRSRTTFSVKMSGPRMVLVMFERKSSRVAAFGPFIR